MYLPQKDERLTGWVGLVGWPYSGRFTHISGAPISCRSSAGRGKYAGQRPTFYHCTTQPTIGLHYRILLHSLLLMFYNIQYNIRLPSDITIKFDYLLLRSKMKVTIRYIRYDSGYLTCSKKLTGSQLSLPHGINKKLKCETKNKMMSVISPVRSRYREAVQ